MDDDILFEEISKMVLGIGLVLESFGLEPARDLYYSMIDKINMEGHQMIIQNRGNLGDKLSDLIVRMLL